VGTVIIHKANIELVHIAPNQICDEEWPIWTAMHQPPAKFVLDEGGRRGAINSMVSGASSLARASAVVAVLQRARPRTFEYFRSVVLPNTKIGAGCTIQRAILDEDCEVPAGTEIGVDRAADSRRFHVTGNGVVLVTVDMLNAIVPANA
jgi:glucose-1-phosphate adenylyltransferase